MSNIKQEIINILFYAFRENIFYSTHLETICFITSKAIVRPAWRITFWIGRKQCAAEIGDQWGACLHICHN